VSTKVQEFMKRAYTRGILIPAFNAAYHEMVKPICETLKRLKTYGLCEISRPDIEKFGIKSFTTAAEYYFKYADPEYMSLHQDHVPVIDEDGLLVDYKKLILEALDAGYQSVMIDGSRISIDENIRITTEIVEIAHARAIPVEAELGAVLGHESGPLPSYEELFSTGKGFTRVEDAARLVRKSGVDWLSVAVGNIHGAITGVAKDEDKVEARLNIEHFRKLQEATGIPLVLHGGSGIKRENILEAVQNGLSKLNIGTDIRHAYERRLRETGSVEDAQDAVAEKMEYLIVEYYGIGGSRQKLTS